MPLKKKILTRSRDGSEKLHLQIQNTFFDKEKAIQDILFEKGLPCSLRISLT